MPLCLGPLPGFCLECIVVSLLGGTLALLKSLRQIKHFSFGLLNLTYFQNSTFIMCAVHSQWCLTLCDPMDWSLLGSCVHRDSPGKNTGVGCHALLQGIFPTRSPTLQVDSLPSESPGKPKNTGVGSLSFLQGIFPTKESNWGLLHCSGFFFFNQLNYQGIPTQERRT